MTCVPTEAFQVAVVELWSGGLNPPVCVCVVQLGAQIRCAHVQIKEK